MAKQKYEERIHEKFKDEKSTKFDVQPQALRVHPTLKVVNLRYPVHEITNSEQQLQASSTTADQHTSQEETVQTQGNDEA
ncbi:unnamed protein product [Ambrosiozyma monospora]|uniref:Unnamed protein product n=1 Tax=Ambrosiozyma monospora TaxID=43982 RepID=A0ACB5UCH5_AMBMO|nr:unnamed protein product [Ambrosiozyma monospora]